MSYRVETASSGRAVCRNIECKKAGIKIDKDELRLGVWVSFEDHGSWHWRHWGCVTGKTIENIRKALEGEDNYGSGVYRWDYLDGFEGEDKNSLEKHPDLQEKVKRVITQGFVDPEDWNGDAEMNVLGATGTRTSKSKKKMKADKAARDQEIEDLKAQSGENAALRDGGGGPAFKKTASKKRAKKEESDDEETEKEVFQTVETPVKKKRTKKVKKEEDEDDDLIKPAKKSRTKKSVKEEDESEAITPIKKSRAKKGVKKEESVSSPVALDNLTNDWSTLTVSELKEELERRGLAKSGRKVDLISRLEADTEQISSPVKPEKKENDLEDLKPVKDEPSEDTTMADAPSSSTTGASGLSVSSAGDKTFIPGVKDNDGAKAREQAAGLADSASSVNASNNSAPVAKASKVSIGNTRKASAPITTSAGAAPKLRRGRGRSSMSAA